MTELKEDWVTNGTLDFEYKKYLLLDYTQKVGQKFSQKELYPILDDLIFHYNNLLTLKREKQILFKSFPKQLSKADFKKLQLTYKRIVKDDEMMQEIEDIVLFAIPRLKSLLANGRDLYEEIEAKLQIEEIGVMPLQSQEGYVFINEYQQPDTKVYSYRMTLFESSQERYRGITVTFLESLRKGIGQTYENLKMDIIRRYQQLPNPATFLINAQVPCPYQPTLMPIAKRVLVRKLTKLSQ